MKLNIDGRLAVISGAAGGLGLATAKVLAEDGARLFLTDTSEDALTEAADTLGSSVVGHYALPLFSLATLPLVPLLKPAK